MIGLKRGTVELHSHEEAWELRAVQTIQLLKKILGNVACDIRHVGSTSIRTIKAKPIIDIAIAVQKLTDILPFIQAMEVHGFRHKHVGDDTQIFFSAGDFEQDIRTHHIHVVELDSMAWRNYLNFTAYLNAFPSVAHAYEQKKEELLVQFSCNREAYTAGKSSFINYSLRKAMVWSYLGKTVTIGIDRPIGYVHKKDIVYPINYGYIPGVFGGDGEELDVYLLGVDEPVSSYTAKIVAVVHRENDVEDKLVAVPDGMTLTQAEITEQVYFQEKYYDSHIELFCDGYTVREYRKVSIDELLPLYQSVGWTNYTSHPDMLEAAVSNSLLTLAAYDHDHLIGLIRAVGDGYSSVLVQDLLILPEYQRRGIGSTLLREIMMRYRHVYQLQLLTDRTEKTLSFYRAMGFADESQWNVCAMIAEQRPKSKELPGIHPMRKEDIPACVAVIREAFMTVADEFGFTLQNAPHFTAFAVSEDRLNWQYQQGRPMFVLCDEKDMPIGFYSLAEKQEEIVELNNLCVLPNYRHHKFGEHLLLHALRESMVHGYRQMTIGIVEENRVLRRWYEKYGFHHIGTEKFDFFPFTCGYLTKELYGEDGWQPRKSN